MDCAGDNSFITAPASLNGWNSDNFDVISPPVADSAVKCRNGKLPISPSREFSNGYGPPVNGKRPPSATVTTMNGNSCSCKSSVFDVKVNGMAHCQRTDVVGCNVGCMTVSPDVDDEATMTNAGKSLRYFESAVATSRHGFPLSGDVDCFSHEKGSACATFASFDEGGAFQPVDDDVVDAFMSARPSVIDSASDNGSSNDVKFCMSGWSYDIDPKDMSIFDMLNI